MEAFLRVVEAGAFSAAARSLNLSQSTLSRQMKHLEDIFDCTLFVRTPNGIRLTAEGEIVSGYARRSLAELADVRNRIVESHAGQKMRIASVSGPLYTVLPEIVASFERQHGVRVLVRETTTDEVSEMVRLRRADIGILNLPVGDGLSVEPLAETELALVLPARHPLAHRRRIDLQEVGDEPFILLTEDQALNRLAVSACQAQGYTPRVAYYARNIHLCIHLVGQGAGVSIVPHSRPLTHLTPTVRFLRIEPPLTRTLALVYLERAPMIGAFIPRLQDGFRAFGD